MAIRSAVHPPTTVIRPAPTVRNAHTRAPQVLDRLGTLPLRLFLGLTFIYAGLDKVADHGYLDPTARGAYLGNQLQQAVSNSPIGFLLETVALPQIQLVGVAVVAAELVVGLLVTTGILTRPAAGVGALLNLTLFLSLTWNIQPYFLAPDSLYTVAWITLALVGDRGALSLQSYIRTRTPPQSWINVTLSRANGLLDRVQAPVLGLGVTAVGLIWLTAILPKSN